MSAATRVWKPIPAPPEIVLDHHFHQVLALQDDGEPFMQYVPCSVCGWLIGCGDAIDTITHNSCLISGENGDNAT